MKWADEVLADLEGAQRVKANREEYALMRARQRHDQAQYRWIDLRGQIQSHALMLNRNAGKTLLIEQPSPGNRLLLRHPDGVGLSVVYRPELYRVSISGSSTCELELLVRQRDGNDTTVWVNRETTAEDSDEKIAQSILRDYLLSLTGAG